MNIQIIILILILHFIADFILQCDRVAVRKSKKWNVLAEHSLIYSLPFLLIGWQYALLNSLLHFMVDAVTSRIASYLWQKNERHWFFTTIGFDQMIHLIILFSTYVYLDERINRVISC